MYRKNLLVNKAVFILVIALLLAFFVCGCKTDNTSDTTSQESVVFTDALNREVSVCKNPKRVAALIGGFADVWMLSGGEVCAAPEDAWSDFDLPLKDVVNIGGAHSPNLETLLDAQPDFVLASASTSSNVALKDVLENAGITVAYFDVDSFSDYLLMLDICTDITGNKDLYVQNGIELQQKIEAVKTEVFDMNLPQKERSILLLRISSGLIKTKGSSGTVLGEMLSEFGCINIADNDKTLLENLNIESIIKKNPHRIFVVVMGDDNKNALDNLERMINENPAWRNLDAIQQKRVYVMDRELFHMKPNAKWARAYEQLGKILLEKEQ